MSLDQKTREADRIYEEFEPPSDWDHDAASDTVILMLPGFKKEQLRVQVTSTRVLRVNGERQISENKWRRFRKEFPLPSDSDTNGISAKFEAGVLYIRLPIKQQPTTPKPTQEAPKPQPQPQQPITTPPQKPNNAQVSDQKKPIMEEKAAAESKLSEGQKPVVKEPKHQPQPQQPITTPPQKPNNAQVSDQKKPIMEEKAAAESKLSEGQKPVVKEPKPQPQQPITTPPQKPNNAQVSDQKKSIMEEKAAVESKLSEGQKPVVKEPKPQPQPQQPITTPPQKPNNAQVSDQKKPIMEEKAAAESKLSEGQKPVVKEPKPQPQSQQPITTPPQKPNNAQISDQKKPIMEEKAAAESKLSEGQKPVGKEPKPQPQPQQPITTPPQKPNNAQVSDQKKPIMEEKAAAESKLSEGQKPVVKEPKAEKGKEELKDDANNKVGKEERVMASKVEEKHGTSEGKMEKKPLNMEMVSLQGREYMNALCGLVDEVKKKKKLVNLLVLIFFVLLFGIYVKNAIKSYF